MFGRKHSLALRYALSRTHLLEQHVNTLYGVLKIRFPDDVEFLDDLLGSWQRSVEDMHAAFRRGDTGYFDDYEDRQP